MTISERIRPLDALRGLGAIAIAVIFHYHHLVPVSDAPFKHALRYIYLHGWVIVEYFFMLSGIVFSFFHYDKIVKRKLSFRNFALARFSRLWPLYVLTLCAVVVLQWYRYKASLPFYVVNANDIYSFILNILMVQSWNIYLQESINGPAWTLSADVFLYILFFFLAQKGKLSNPVCLLLIAIGITFTKTGNGSCPVVFVNYSMGRGLVAFFWGVLLSRIITFIIDKNKERTAIILSISALLVFFALKKLLGIEMVAKGTDVSMVYVILVHPAVIFIAIFQKHCRKILMSPLLQKLGKISFTIYVVHFPIQVLMSTISYYRPINLSSPLTMGVYGAIIVLVSVLVYRFFEIPAKNYIRNRFMAQA